MIRSPVVEDPVVPHQRSILINICDSGQVVWATHFAAKGIVIGRA